LSGSELMHASRQADNNAGVVGMLLSTTRRSNSGDPSNRPEVIDSNDPSSGLILLPASSALAGAVAAVVFKEANVASAEESFTRGGAFFFLWDGLLDKEKKDPVVCPELLEVDIGLSCIERRRDDGQRRSTQRLACS